MFISNLKIIKGFVLHFTKMVKTVKVTHHLNDKFIIVTDA